VFWENSYAGKAKLNKFNLFATIVARFTEVSISTQHAIPEVNKYGFHCSALSLYGLNRSTASCVQGRRSVVAKAEETRLRQETTL